MSEYVPSGVAVLALLTCSKVGISTRVTGPGEGDREDFDRFGMLVVNESLCFGEKRVGCVMWRERRD